MQGNNYFHSIGIVLGVRTNVEMIQSVRISYKKSLGLAEV
jgi:hypothetical protein